jgi:hypothetical protein
MPLDPSAYCEKYDLPASSCGHCTGAEARVARKERAERGRVIEARYAGVCSGCDAEIRRGDQIRADGRGGWLCPVCIS